MPFYELPETESILAGAGEGNPTERHPPAPDPPSILAGAGEGNPQSQSPKAAVTTSILAGVGEGFMGWAKERECLERR